MKRKPPPAPTPFSVGVCEGDVGFPVAASPRPAISFVGAKRQVAVAASNSFLTPRSTFQWANPAAGWQGRFPERLRLFCK